MTKRLYSITEFFNLRLFFTEYNSLLARHFCNTKSTAYNATQSQMFASTASI